MTTNNHNHINYIEFPMQNAEATKKFYSEAFQWEFMDWGESYISFSGAGVEGGFEKDEMREATSPGVLVVLYSDNLEDTLTTVTGAGGKIIKPIYGFPGGRRFHFLDPNGNELAVWAKV
ncbi:MAG: VOC family protein [Methyloligellaceae bacterium]